MTEVFELSNNIKEILEEHLYVLEFLNEEQLKSFYNMIAYYLKNRTRVETFEVNLVKTVDLLQTFGLNSMSIITCIFNWPSIIHTDKMELYKKYLILAKPIQAGVSNIDRNDILTNYTKDFMISFSLLYARIEFFLSDLSNNFTRKDCITRRKLFKTTSTEFEMSYGITKEKLLEMFPFREDEFERIKEYEMNKAIVAKYEGKNEKNGWTI